MQSGQNERVGEGNRFRQGARRLTEFGELRLLGTRIADLLPLRRCDCPPADTIDHFRTHAQAYGPGDSYVVHVYGPKLWKGSCSLTMCMETAGWGPV